MSKAVLDGGFVQARGGRQRMGKPLHESVYFTRPHLEVVRIGSASAKTNSHDFHLPDLPAVQIDCKPPKHTASVAHGASDALYFTLSFG